MSLFSMRMGGRITLTQTYSVNTLKAALSTNSLPNYVAGQTDVYIVVNAGVYLWSDDTAQPGLKVTISNPLDRVFLVNNGFIIGMGGEGASYNYDQEPAGDYAQNATAGGPALEVVGGAIQIDNANGYIAGGGGGGGAWGGTSLGHGASGGGGAGGGKSGRVIVGGITYQANGGAVGVAGSNGAGANLATSGGGGGRIVPGTITVGPTITAGPLDNDVVRSNGIGGQAGGSGGVASLTDHNGFTLGTYFKAGGGGGGWGQPGGRAMQVIHGATGATGTGGTGGNTSGGGDAYSSTSYSNTSVTSGGDPQADSYHLGGAGGAGIKLTSGASHTIVSGVGRIYGTY